MSVHWKHKWMEISYEEHKVLLQGVVPDLPEELLLQVCVLAPSGSSHTSVQLLPTEVQSLLDQFEHLFKEPVGLPPSRACDHEIPLIPGARPVNIRPYTYPPSTTG